MLPKHDTDLPPMPARRFYHRWRGSRESVVQMRLIFAILAMLITGTAAAAQSSAVNFGIAQSPIGWLALIIFVLAYLGVVFENRLNLAKSKPVLLGAALIWGLLAWQVGGSDDAPVRKAFEAMFLEFSELFFFLVVAMTYVTGMGERGVFEALRASLTRRNLGFRSLFWMTGIIGFFLSALLDNLTTSLVMSAVILAVGGGSSRFVVLAFINLVVAANAGGAWSAFGDITTLMVWQAHRVEFFEFFRLFVPSLVTWLSGSWS